MKINSFNFMTFKKLENTVFSNLVIIKYKLCTFNIHFWVIIIVNNAIFTEIIAIDSSWLKNFCNLVKDIEESITCHITNAKNKFSSLWQTNN